MVVKFKHIKVLLSGPGGAGKSSFCRRLFEEKFIPEHIRTEIMETKQCLTMDKKIKTDDEGVTSTSFNTSKGKLIKLDPKTQMRQINTLLRKRMFHLCKSARDQSAPRTQASDDDDTSESKDQPTELDVKILNYKNQSN